jgi:hypothetical protein
MTTYLTPSLSTLRRHLLGKHDGATAANVRALHGLLQVDSGDWRANRLQTMLRDAIAESRESINNCVGVDDYRAVECYAAAKAEGLTDDDALEHAAAEHVAADGCLVRCEAY